MVVARSVAALELPRLCSGRCAKRGTDELAAEKHRLARLFHGCHLRGIDDAALVGPMTAPDRWRAALEPSDDELLEAIRKAKERPGYSSPSVLAVRVVKAILSKKAPLVRQAVEAGSVAVVWDLSGKKLNNYDKAIVESAALRVLEGE